MMKCEVIRDLLPLYIDDACSKASRELVEEHLKECGDCQKAFSQMKKCIVTDEQELEQNMEDKQILKTGKQAIKRAVKKDYLEKTAVIDLPLNVIIALCGIWMCVTPNGWDREYLADTLPVLLVAFVAIPVMFSIWEIVFITGSKKGKGVSTSQMLVMTSVLVKVIALLVIGVCGLAVVLG